MPGLPVVRSQRPLPTPKFQAAREPVTAAAMSERWPPGRAVARSASSSASVVLAGTRTSVYLNQRFRSASTSCQQCSTSSSWICNLFAVPRTDAAVRCSGPLHDQIGLLAVLRPHERVLVLMHLLGGEQRVELARSAIEAV